MEDGKKKNDNTESGITQKIMNNSRCPGKCKDVRDAKHGDFAQDNGNRY
jgi:hypothetical protein